MSGRSEGEMRRHYGELIRSPSSSSRRQAIAAACALLALVSAAAAAQTSPFRDPASAPPSWTQFAKLVKYRFEEWLGADDAIAARFRVYLKAHAGASDGPPPTLIVQAWVSPDGSVERVSFPTLGDAGATKDLTTILSSGNIGERPPPEMLQPIRLRFSLGAVK